MYERGTPKTVRLSFSQIVRLYLVYHVVIPLFFSYYLMGNILLFPSSPSSSSNKDDLNQVEGLPSYWKKYQSLLPFLISTTPHQIQTICYILGGSFAVAIGVFTGSSMWFFFTLESIIICSYLFLQWGYSFIPEKVIGLSVETLYSIILVCLLSNTVAAKVFSNRRDKTFDYVVTLGLLFYLLQSNGDTGFISTIWNREAITNILLIAPLLISPTIKNLILPRSPLRKNIMNTIFSFLLFCLCLVCIGIFLISKDKASPLYTITSILIVFILLLVFGDLRTEKKIFRNRPLLYPRRVQESELASCWGIFALFFITKELFSGTYLSNNTKYSCFKENEESYYLEALPNEFLPLISILLGALSTLFFVKFVTFFIGVWNPIRSGEVQMVTLDTLAFVFYFFGPLTYVLWKSYGKLMSKLTEVSDVYSTQYNILISAFIEKLRRFISEEAITSANTMFEKFNPVNLFWEKLQATFKVSIESDIQEFFKNHEIFLIIFLILVTIIALTVGMNHYQTKNITFAYWILPTFTTGTLHSKRIGFTTNYSNIFELLSEDFSCEDNKPENEKYNKTPLQTLIELLEGLKFYLTIFISSEDIKTIEEKDWDLITQCNYLTIGIETDQTKMPSAIMKSVTDGYSNVADCLETAKESTGKTKTLKWFYRRHGNQNPFALLRAASLGLVYLYPQITFSFYPLGKKRTEATDNARFTEFLNFVEKHYQGGIVWLKFCRGKAKKKATEESTGVVRLTEFLKTLKITFESNGYLIDEIENICPDVSDMSLDTPSP